MKVLRPREPRRLHATRRLDLVRWKHDFTPDAELRAELAALCRRHGICDAEYRPRYSECCRLLICIAIVRIAGRPPLDAVPFAIGSNKLMLVGAMFKRVLAHYATAPRAKRGGHVPNQRIGMTVDPWMHKQLTHLAPLYRQSDGTVLDKKMVLDLIRRGICDGGHDAVFAEYVSQIEPIRRALEAEERRIYAIVDRATGTTAGAHAAA